MQQTEDRKKLINKMGNERVDERGTERKKNYLVGVFLVVA